MGGHYLSVLSLLPGEYSLCFRYKGSLARYCWNLSMRETDTEKGRLLWNAKWNQTRSTATVHIRRA